MKSGGCGSMVAGPGVMASNAVYGGAGGAAYGGSAAGQGAVSGAYGGAAGNAAYGGLGSTACGGSAAYGGGGSTAPGYSVVGPGGVNPTATGYNMMGPGGVNPNAGVTYIPGSGGGACCGPSIDGNGCGCGPSASAGECTGAACGAETMCCEPEGGLASVQWVQVSGGSYSPAMSYQFVGEGSGTYERTVVTSYYGWKFRKCCLCICGLLLLALLIPLLMSLFSTEDEPVVTPPAVITVPTPVPTRAPDVVVTPQPTPAPVPVARKTCLIFGDPHALTFDGVRADYYTPGEYWIVKSKTIWIQGKYQPTRMTNGLAVTKEVGISGPLLKNHKLVIGVDFITWDGVSIQQGFDQLGFMWRSVDPAVSLVYNSQGTIMQKSRAGKALHVVHVQLPNSIALEVNRWSEPHEGHYINLRVMMAQQPEQDGHCGNFNNDASDDKRTAVRARVGKTGVPEDLLIFPGPKTAINPSGRPDLNDCPEGELKIAMEKCKAAENKFFPSHACLIDTCLGHLAPKP